MILPRVHCITSNTLSVFTLLLLLPRTSTQEPVAFIAPLTYTAYLGQVPAVRFHCSVANASGVAWSINGDIRQLDWLEDRGVEITTGQSSLESTLIISSRVVNNNTRILCLARRIGSFAYKESVEATFRVQGALERCPNLQIIPSGNYHQRLTWDPPSTLNVTAVEPDIYSYIVCSNISNECTTINVTEAGSNSSDLRQYTFLNLRAYIDFTVTAVNIVGHGESASILYRPCEHMREGSSSERFKSQDLSAMVSFDSENAPSLSLEVMSHRRCFDVYVIYFEQEIGNKGFYERNMIKSDWIIPSVSDSGDEALTLNVTINSTLSTNTFYRATLITAVDMVEAGSIQFSTYDVQDVELQGGRGNISIQCVFAFGSQARGCHVEIRNSSMDKISTFLMNLTRNGNPLSHTAEQTTVTGLTPGSYEVFVFDWERYGSVASTPSYVGHANISEPVTVNTSTPPAVGNGGSSPWPPSPTGTVATHPHFNPVIAAGIGSAAAVLLLAVVIVITFTSIALLKPKNTVNTEEAHYSTANSDQPYYSTVNREEPYYSNIQEFDAIEMKRNDAYETPSQLQIRVEENPAYRGGGLRTVN